MKPVVEGHRLLHIETEFDGSQNLVCTVQNSGTGIEPEKVDRIFDRFYTTKSDGLGVGLAICRTIIRHLAVTCGRTGTCRGV